MRRMAIALAVVLLGAASGSTAEVTGVQVQQALDRGVDYLRKSQNADGTWPDYGRPGGVTCLAVLALLTAGVSEDDPALQKALPWITAIANQATYVVSLKAMVLAAANPTTYRKDLEACAKWLIGAQVATGPTEGMWTYGTPGRGGDNSNTQFAVLGLDACARAGVPVPQEVWARIERHFRTSQGRDGGWSYNPGQPQSYGSMTAAGLGSLYFAGVRLQTDFDQHTCGRYRQDKAITEAINWFAQNFSVTQNPKGSAQWYYYYLYGLERVGMVSALKYLGAHNWYKEGVTELVRLQGADGGWDLPGVRSILGGAAPVQAATRVMHTAFSILFLAKGRAPVLVQKLHWKGDWNNDPYDIAHLVQFVGSQWGHALSWQVVQPSAPVEELLESPILYLNGHTAPFFEEAEKSRLREYLDQGGFLLAEACCGRPAFDLGFRRLMAEMLPEPEWKLRRLPDDHPIYTAYYKWEGPRFLEGIDLHCRTAVVYLPQDLSCAWHMDRPQDLGAFKLGTNICAYATGMEPLKDKLDRVTVVTVKDVLPGSDRRGALLIGKVRHNGQWNMDVLAIPKLLSEMTRKANLAIVTRHHPLAVTDKDLFDYPLIYMSGAYTFTMTDEEKARLREYLNRGGVLFANALSGKPAFDAAFRDLMKDLFPQQPLEALPLNHPIYSCGYAIEQVKYTRAVREEHPGLDKPTLEGITVNNRTVVVYSKYDIGCALDSGAVLHGRGYLRDCAFRLATNVVLYALSF